MTIPAATDAAISSKAEVAGPIAAIGSPLVVMPYVSRLGEKFAPPDVERWARASGDT